MLYVAVDEGYDPTRIKGLQGIADFMVKHNLRLSDGSKPTKANITQELKNQCCVRAYSFTLDELEEVAESGSIRGKGWDYRIAKI